MQDNNNNSNKNKSILSLKTTKIRNDNDNLIMNEKKWFALMKKLHRWKCHTRFDHSLFFLGFEGGSKERISKSSA